MITFEFFGGPSDGVVQDQDACFLVNGVPGFIAVADESDPGKVYCYKRDDEPPVPGTECYRFNYIGEKHA